MEGVAGAAESGVVQRQEGPLRGGGCGIAHGVSAELEEVLPARKRGCPFVCGVGRINTAVSALRRVRPYCEEATRVDERQPRPFFVSVF